MTHYAPKNHAESDAHYVIGGKVTLLPEASVDVKPGCKMPGTWQAPYMSDAGSDVSTVAALRAEHNELLSKLRAAGLMASQPTVAITVQPEGLALTAGAIENATLAVAAQASNGGVLTYQWYSNLTQSNAGGSAISGATEASYDIPADTAAGTHYYYAVASHEGVSAASEPATVTVAAGE